MKFKLILVILISSFYIKTVSSQNYKIDIKINDLQNKEIFLGYYYGDKTYVRDTTILDNNGRGTFRGDSLLGQGMYIIVMPSKNYFDILIDDDQEFSLETSTKDLISNLKIKGSEINSSFIEFQENMSGLNKKSHEIQEKLKKLDENNDSTEILKNQLNELSLEVKEYWNEITNKNKTNLLGIVVNLMKNPEIPEIEVPENIQNKDSVRWFHSYNYNRNHYLDKINFGDSRYLRTPIFHNKLEIFFTKVLIQNPDTLNKYIDKVAKLAENDEEMFQYIVRYFINTFQKSNIMGMDKVFVYVAEKYYLSGIVDWLDEETLQKLREQVAKLRFNLIGNIAQDMKMETLEKEYAQLHEVKSKFILVYFWEPDCGHCKKVTPKIRELYQQYNRDEFEVFAVYTQGDQEEWNEFVFEKGYDDWINVWDPYNLTNFRLFYNIYSTPTIYLLDKDKKIIAKRISHETLKNILEIELKKK